MNKPIKDNPNLTPLGNFLRRYRIKHEIYLYEMADKLECTGPGLSGMEHYRDGKSWFPIPDDLYDRLLQHYEFTEDELCELRQALGKVKRERNAGGDGMNRPELNMMTMSEKDYEVVSNYMSYLEQKVLDLQKTNAELGLQAVEALAERDQQGGNGIRLSPDHGYGNPTVNGTNTNTRVVSESYFANDTKEYFVAELFNISPADVINCVRFETILMECNIADEKVKEIIRRFEQKETHDND